MSHALNDEQWEALREWWRYYGPDDPIESKVASVRVLHDAIAPLMKPWRVERHPQGAPYIVGPLVNAHIEVNGLGYQGSGELAERICRVLNGEERW